MSRLYKPKAGFWIRLAVILIYPFDTLVFRIRWRHLDRIPPPSSGGVLIAVNHVSIVDTVLMARVVWDAGRIPRFLIKSGVFHVIGLGQLMRGAKQIPVHRGTADASQSLHEAVEALERGEAIVIYPEGTITRDPEQWPMEGKTGVARLVLLSPDTPVVPVGQWGAQRRRSLPWWQRFGRREALASVGMPMDLSGYRGEEPSADTLREITDLIMTAVREEVAQLRGQPAPLAFFKPTKKYVDRRVLRKKAS
jgi:1-acyl-sn-glycerol-3-phosphate acyltransferase